MSENNDLREDALQAANRPPLHPYQPPAAKWWAGNDDEYFTEGPFDSRDEALQRAQELMEDNDTFIAHITEAVSYDIRFNAVRLIDDQYYDSDDLFDHDHAEPDREGDWNAANEELQALLDDWTHRHRGTFAQPNMFKSSKTETVTRDLPEGLELNDMLQPTFTCQSCEKTVAFDGDIADFDPDMALCGGSPRCLP